MKYFLLVLLLGFTIAPLHAETIPTPTETRAIKAAQAEEGRISRREMYERQLVRDIHNDGGKLTAGIFIDPRFADDKTLKELRAAFGARGWNLNFGLTSKESELPKSAPITKPLTFMYVSIVEDESK